MREKVDLTGIILSSMPVGDYDKRLVILTKERGKITVFARAARKPNSPYLGVSEPFNFGTFSLAEGYDAYYLNGADVKEYFLDVKNDIEGICYGTYFCDVLEYLCVDGFGDVNILNLLYVTLKALGRPEISKHLIRRIFEVKVLTYDGEGMVAFECCMCGKQSDLAAFFLSGNGFVCTECSRKLDHVKYLHQSTIYTIQYIMSSSLKKLYSFQVNDDVMLEMDEVIGNYFTKHVPRKFKSLDILVALS